MRRSTSKLGLAVALATGFAGALLCCGCQFYHYSEHTLNAPGEQASETDAPRVTVDMANSAQFRAVPLQVQHAFALDYGDASVTCVQMIPTGTGGMFYKIGYIENGTPGQAVYHADGATAAASEGVVILPEPGEVPIAPLQAELPAPSTEPTTQPAGAAARDFQ
jgi:hypothetical protein